MRGHTRRLAFLGGLLWLACATPNPKDVVSPPPAASPAASGGSCFRGNRNYRHVTIGNSPDNDASIFTPSTGGVLARKDVRKTVEHYMPRIRKCYQAASLRSPNLEGSVAMAMAVTADGSISDSWTLGLGLGGTEGGAELEDCLGRALCEMVLPKPKGNASTVVYQTFQFDKGTICVDSCLPAHAGLPDGSGSRLMGSLDKEIIQGVIREHIPAVRACYEKGLSGNAELKGRVACQFTIAANGTVIASVIQSSTMNDVKVEDCVRQEIRNWEFPKPIGGGIVIVSYPFNFTAGQQKDPAQ
jgi:hypothetical protein